MPSKNTSILSARIKDEDILLLTNIADSANLTVPKLIHAIVDGFRYGNIEMDGQEVKGVTPDEMDTSRLKKVAERHKMPPQRLLEELLDMAERG